MLKKKIAITGSSGFIGSHLTLKLLDLGHTVLGVDNHRFGCDYHCRIGRYLAVLSIALRHFADKVAKELQRTQTIGSLTIYFALVTITPFLVFLFIGKKFFFRNHLKE